MKRRAIISLVSIVVVTVALMAGTFVAGNEPLLGLDLQGGVSVVLQPTEDVTDDQLDEAVRIIRLRVDSLGVAEPEITRQGDTILVQIPGVDDQDRALELVGQTAELRFRPVLRSEPLVNPETGDPLPEVEGGLAVEDLTSPDDDEADAVVILPQHDSGGNETVRYELGPTALTGDALRTARASLDQVGQWVVLPIFKSGSPGIDDFNAVALECFGQNPEVCPTGQVAIVLDGNVISAPVIQTPTFEADSIQISGAFGQREAEDLAVALRFGALPVELEPQAAQVVSATIGEDALKAGVTAGLIGLGLSALYMIAYYRLLGLGAVLSLCISGGLLWVIIAFLGETRGLALTLAGVTGIIVAIGVSLDSNVVYFEHLKEDLRNGRTLRSSVERSFITAFSTIVKANLATLIGAVVLYWLTIGPVRGFALYLGVATVLDLVATYFFMRPAAILLARWKRAEDTPALLGLPKARTDTEVASGGVIA